MQDMPKGHLKNELNQVVNVCGAKHFPNRRAYSGTISNQNNSCSQTARDILVLTCLLMNCISIWQTSPSMQDLNY